MTKDFDVENAARRLIADGVLRGKVSKLNLMSVLRVLAGWVRSANLRAKTAEENLREMPNWQARYHGANRANQQLQQQLERTLANERALEDRAREYAEMNDKMVDAHTKEVAELEALVAHLKAVVEAAILRGNRLAELTHIQHQLAAADIALAALGVPYEPSKKTDS